MSACSCRSWPGCYVPRAPDASKRWRRSAAASIDDGGRCSSRPAGAGSSALTPALAGLARRARSAFSWYLVSRRGGLYEPDTDCLIAELARPSRVIGGGSGIGEAVAIGAAEQGAARRRASTRNEAAAQAVGVAAFRRRGAAAARHPRRRRPSTRRARRDRCATADGSTSSSARRASTCASRSCSTPARSSIASSP